MIRLPVYKPDEQEVELLEERAELLGYWLGCQHIYTMQFISLYLDAEALEKPGWEAQGPTAGDIGWGLHEPQQYVDDRLREMEKLGLVACAVEWEPDPLDPQDRFGKPVGRYTLTEEGNSLLSPPATHGEAPMRVRVSALAERSALSA